MKFRTISRLKYLKRARHRRGHGIHSPFLFHLITTVLEDKRSFPEYKIFKDLSKKALVLLDHYSDPSITKVYHQFNLAPSHPRKLYHKIELPIRFGKVVFRLIREFNPSSILNYGPTLGANLALMAMASNYNPVYQIDNDRIYELFSRELLKDTGISNIYFFGEEISPAVNPGFVMINSPDRPEFSRLVAQKIMEMHCADCVLIIRGIHESKEMQLVWQELIASESVRVSLDLFGIGIALFREGLQKENFIHRF